MYNIDLYSRNVDEIPVPPHNRQEQENPILNTLWRTTAFGILSCSVSYFKNIVINMNTPNPMDIPNYISSSDIIQVLSRQRALRHREGSECSFPPPSPVEKGGRQTQHSFLG
jgi:hypothetical protein